MNVRGPHSEEGPVILSALVRKGMTRIQHADPLGTDSSLACAQGRQAYGEGTVQSDSAKTTDENDYEALVWEQGSKILGDP